MKTNSNINTTYINIPNWDIFSYHVNGTSRDIKLNYDGTFQFDIMDTYNFNENDIKKAINQIKQESDYKSLKILIHFDVNNLVLDDHLDIFVNYLEVVKNLIADNFNYVSEGETYFNKNKAVYKFCILTLGQYRLDVNKYTDDLMKPKKKETFLNKLKKLVNI